MFWRTTISQTGYLLRKKNAVIVFYILLAMVLFNFISNVVAFQGRDVLNMYQPMKLLLLSYNRTNYNADMTILLIQVISASGGMSGWVCIGKGISDGRKCIHDCPS